MHPRVVRPARPVQQMRTRLSAIGGAAHSPPGAKQLWAINTPLLRLELRTHRSASGGAAHPPRGACRSTAPPPLSAACWSTGSAAFAREKLGWVRVEMNPATAWRASQCWQQQQQAQCRTAAAGKRHTSQSCHAAHSAKSRQLSTAAAAPSPRRLLPCTRLQHVAGPVRPSRFHPLDGGQHLHM